MVGRWSCGLNDEITRCWNRQMYLKIFNKYRECSLRRSVLTDSLKTVCWSLIKSLEFETEKLVTLRSRSFIYTGRGRAGKFKFEFVWRLHVAATLFYNPEFIYYYVICILTILILRDKTITWFELSSSSCPATDVSEFKQFDCSF